MIMTIMCLLSIWCNGKLLICISGLWYKKGTMAIILVNYLLTALVKVNFFSHYDTLLGLSTLCLSLPLVTQNSVPKDPFSQGFNTTSVHSLPIRH